MAGNEKQPSQKPQAQRPQSKREDGTIYIGNKPVMAYVLAVVTQFNNGSNGVNIKARGRAISRAVDVAEVVRRKFLTQANLKAISIGTEHLAGERGEVDVSTIEIQLTK
ncbi:MAG: DNA-binding protein Alba [Halobacteria archaeon]